MLTATRLGTFEKFATFGHFVENQIGFHPLANRVIGSKATSAKTTPLFVIEMSHHLV